MSKGFGVVQCGILAALADGTVWSTLDLVCGAYRIEPDEEGIRYYTAAQYAAVRRALLNLEAQGRVTRLGAKDTPLYWMSAEADALRRQNCVTRHGETLSASDLVRSAKNQTGSWRFLKFRENEIRERIY